MSDYGQQYTTSYGANGAADGGGFIGGEPNSSQAGAGGVSLLLTTGLVHVLTTKSNEDMAKTQFDQ